MVSVSRAFCEFVNKASELRISVPVGAVMVGEAGVSGESSGEFDVDRVERVSLSEALGGERY